MSVRRNAAGPYAYTEEAGYSSLRRTQALAEEITGWGKRAKRNTDSVFEKNHVERYRKNRKRKNGTETTDSYVEFHPAFLRERQVL